VRSAHCVSFWALSRPADNVEEAEAVEAELQALEAGSSGSQVEELSKEIDSLKDR
jgi:hypothetical protein